MTDPSETPAWAEHPRPQMRRQRWVELTGQWEFAFDDRNIGLAERWQERDGVGAEGPFDLVVEVPFAWQARLSGVGEDPNAVHDVVWYRRLLPATALGPDDRLVVHFDAIDYEALVWVNGRLVANHCGGQTSFSADITDALGPGENVIVIRAEDFAADPSLPRGKQDWKPIPSGIHYTRTTGIHGRVWAEVVDRFHIESLRLTPDVDRASLHVALRLAERASGTRVLAVASIDGREAGRATLVPGHASAELSGTMELSGAPLVLWEPAPGRPALYDLELELRDPEGAVRDRVTSYFGMRKLEVRDGRLCVNGREVFVRGVLDQRWDRDGLMTPPDGDGLRRDVELALACGFNLVRIHQKREDLRYYAWADRLGLMLTGEAANAFHFTPTYVRRITSEWIELVDALYNSPAVVAWLPINESWGCRALNPSGRGASGPFHPHHVTAMYHLTKSLDPTRPCASNDGWEHTRSDLTGVHDYGGVEELRQRVRQLDGPGGVRRLRAGPGAPVYVDGGAPPGEAVIYTEFGGLFRGRSPADIGYAAYTDDEEFYTRFGELIATLVAEPRVAGFVYTQWKDVESETNGLLADDGSLKWDLERIRAAVSQPRPGAAVSQPRPGESA